MKINITQKKKRGREIKPKKRQAMQLLTTG